MIFWVKNYEILLVLFDFKFNINHLRMNQNIISLNKKNFTDKVFNPLLRFTAVLAFLLFSSQSFAQEKTEQKTKSIEVVGSAEKEVVPDELFFTVVLKEYSKDNKDKVGLEKLEKQLKQAVSGAGIPIENFQVENIFGYTWEYYNNKKREPQEFLASKSYIIKVGNPNKLNEVLEKVDSKGINQVYLKEHRYSQIESLKKDLKIQALKNAKETAKYLLESINEQLGEVIHVVETEMPQQGPIYYRSAMRSDEAASSESEIGFKTVKLKFEIRAEFRIK